MISNNLISSQTKAIKRAQTELNFGQRATSSYQFSTRSSSQLFTQTSNLIHVQSSLLQSEIQQKDIGQSNNVNQEGSTSSPELSKY